MHSGCHLSAQSAKATNHERQLASSGDERLNRRIPSQRQSIEQNPARYYHLGLLKLAGSDQAKYK
jgi:hypothetical protein